MQIIRVFTLVLLALLSAGSLRAQNETDSQGRKQGKWVVRYSGGKIKYTGEYKDDQPVGWFEYFDLKYNLQAKMFHSLEHDTVEAQLYHKNGKMSATGKYVDKVKEGIWILYDMRGQTLLQENYVHGVKQGDYRLFYPGGQVMRIGAYKDGVEHGMRADYYDNGNLLFKGMMDEGEMDGEVDWWHENGQKKIDGQYDNHVKVGTWRYYDTDGQLLETEEYIEGRLQTD